MYLYIRGKKNLAYAHKKERKIRDAHPREKYRPRHHPKTATHTLLDKNISMNRKKESGTQRKKGEAKKSYSVSEKMLSLI